MIERPGDRGDLVVRDLVAPGVEVAALRVAAGECVAVMGPSGGGKTRMLRAIADLDPSAGEVVAAGIERNAVSGPAWRRIVGYVPAESGWWADSVGHHFAEPGRVRPLLAAMGLAADVLGWATARLSSGERQRLALARAIGQAPRALLLDEPTGALDDETRAMVEAVLRRELERGIPILMVTHDRAQAARLAARTVRIEGGRLREAIAG